MRSKVKYVFNMILILVMFVLQVSTYTVYAAPGEADLVVTDITWTPAEPAIGNEITFSAVIKNQGTAASPEGTIHGVLFSVNGTAVSWSDNYTASIPAGASVTVTATGSASGKNTWTGLAGTHTVRAFVDDVNRITESNENNNTFDKQIIIPTQGVGNPDLVVTDITWTPANPITGDEIRFSAVIKNQGTGASPAGTIHGVLFSVNGTAVGWSDNYTASIPAGASITVAATGSASGKNTWTGLAGTHTVRAFVDDVNRITESNENNNTFDKQIIIPTQGVGNPDLVVTDITWTPANPITGDEIRFSAVIKNQGTGASPAGTIHGVLFSVNGTAVSWSDNYSASIPAGGSVTVAATGSASGKNTWTGLLGTHTIRAFVDDINRIPESNDNNNTFEKSIIVNPPSKPDLVVTDLTWSPAVPKTGNAVSFTTTVRNQGTAPVPAGTKCEVGFFVNGTKVTWVGNYTSSIAAGDTVILTADSGISGATWTAAQGYHSIRAEVDGGNLISELDESNNSLSKPLEVDITTSNRGATLPFITHEAENAVTNAAILPYSTAYRTAIQSEASGRRAVRMDKTGDYVEFTLTQPANSIVIRYCIPDAPNGGGITAPLSIYVNGTRNQAISLTSKFAWQYGSYPWTNNPSAGNPHTFFDDSRMMFSTTYPAGTKIKLQKDASDTAAYYIIDLVDFENVAAPLAQPANSLSIVSYGATPNGGGDDAKAIRDCIAAAKAQGKTVWIPAGTFDLATGPISVDNVTIRGAGMWYSVLSGRGASFALNGNNCRFYDFAIFGGTMERIDSALETGFDGNAGTGSIIQNIWGEHLKCGVWVNAPTDGLLITGCRFRNTFADGVNICGGTKNSTVQQSHFRNTGDDSIAIWSASWISNNPCQGNTVKYNTVQSPWLANGIAVYGGANNTVEYNLVKDIVAFGAGINVSSNFDPVPFSGTTTVRHNTIERAGSYEWNHNYARGAIWMFVAQKDIDAVININNIDVYNSTYDGIVIEGPYTLRGATTFDRININGAGAYGINIRNSARGSATFTNVNVTGANSGGLLNAAGGNFTINKGTGNSGW